MSYFNKTEEQEFNEVKSWFKENGTPILVAIIVAAASWAGWNFWKNHQIQSAQEASAKYQMVMESYLQNPSKNDPLVSQFVQDNQGSNYAIFALLEQAKQGVESGDFAKAKTLLTQALNDSSDLTLQNVIRLRLAAIDFQLEKFDDALATLSQVQDEAWTVRKAVLTGDILQAKGDKAAAQSAFEQAKAKANEAERLLIEARLNNL